MAKPSIESMRDVLTEQDWLWSPYFTITPLKSGEIERVVSQYYSAVDKWIGDMEETWEIEETPDTHVSHPQNSQKNSRPDEREHSKAKQYCDDWRQKARNALMTHTHVGMWKPFAVRHRRLLENLGIFSLFRKSTSLYYFAIAWQFGEWYEHVLEVYYDTQHRRLEDQYQKTSEKLEGTVVVTGEQKDALRDTVLGYVQSKQIDLLEDHLDSVFDEGEEDFHHKELLLDVWIHLRGISLDVSGKEDVLDYTYDRFETRTQIE